MNEETMMKEIERIFGVALDALCYANQKEGTSHV